MVASDLKVLVLLDWHQNLYDFESGVMERAMHGVR